MSRALDDVNDAELEAELAARRRARLGGRCDYCNGDATSVPCKHPDRHELPWKGASIVLPDLECDACAPSPDPKCSTCRGTGKKFDEFATVFQTNLIAIFGERTTELSPLLCSKLRELWDAGRRGAEKKPVPQVPDRNALAFRIEKPRAAREESGSFWFNATTALVEAQPITIDSIREAVAAFSTLPKSDENPFRISGLALHDSISGPSPWLSDSRVLNRAREYLLQMEERALAQSRITPESLLAFEFAGEWKTTDEDTSRVFPDDLLKPHR